MACVNADGTLTATGKKILRSIENPRTVNEIAEYVLVPLFMLRSSIRELVSYGYVEEMGETYKATEKGKEKMY